MRFTTTKTDARGQTYCLMPVAHIGGEDIKTQNSTLRKITRCSAIAETAL